jgi:hypothetical protein
MAAGTTHSQPQFWRRREIADPLTLRAALLLRDRRLAKAASSGVNEAKRWWFDQPQKCLGAGIVDRP